MKKTLLIIACGLAIAACNDGGSEGFRIEGSLEGDLADGTQVILRKSDENMQPVDVDTATLDAGRFSFAGTADQPELYYLFVKGVRGGIPLILENGTIDVRAHKDSLQAAELSGTPQNDAYAAYIQGAREKSRQRLSMNEDMRKAVMEKDTVMIESLRDEYFELLDRMTQYEKDFVRENPDALISALVLNRMLQSNAVPVAEVEELYRTLSEEIRETTHGSGISEKLESAKRTAIGAKAPAFSAPTPDGDPLALSEALGKVTLVDFWAAWCRPCRAENPNIVRVYNKYKDKGFKVLGVSLDRNAEDWKQAIADDNLDWQHVSNVRYFDEIAELYNVSAIPASFILDENGVIVAKNLRGDALEEKVAELLP
ncbi:MULTISPECIES: TlpA disulfide reductase family protein [unclassified Robiginitalea]|mgnify:CR=1 FL=1|uniref:TlpA disulfide reductase family protein n=1 Tax=Robiginitalea TaxID=252306 RepID=UPI00234B8538|nr:MULTISPECIES: TlpA disulfide reductase family protein [unclassified Robiginitalea]MDC6354003.1 TlpA disulfide reductase family protein [Robiginitalea sp. PM2]MDC6374270.1 TlpA disulfide reductase family protein [Robiginitalea sp. SP8]